MGKANRIKNEKAANTLAAPVRKKAEKKPMPTWVGTLIVAAVLIALILVVTFSVLQSRGTFMRMRVIAETENYEITVPMMSYMIYSEYQNLVSTYDQLSQQIYGSSSTQKLSIPAGKGGTALVTGSPLRDQVYQSQDDKGNPIDTVTWFDHFAEGAMDTLTEILACCEYAKDKGIELEEKEILEIQTSLDNLELYAGFYGYTTDGYIASMYGKGVRLKDVKAVMELSSLASKVQNQVSDEMLAAILDERVDNHYNENKTKYDTYMDYLTYTFTATFTPSTLKDETKKAEENATLKAEYEAKQAEYAGYVAELNACTTSEQFATKLTEILQKVFEAEELEAAEGKLKEGESLTDKQKEECKQAATERVVKAVSDATVKNGDTSKVSDEDAKEWLTGTGDKALAAGAHNKFESVYDVYGTEVKDEDEDDGEGDGEPDAQAEKEYKKATSTYSVYFVNSALHRDSGVVRSVGHILFKTDTFKSVTDVTKLAMPYQRLAHRITSNGGKISAETMAKELIAVMKEDGNLTEKTDANGRKYYEISEAQFNAYGLTYTEDSNVFYDDVTVGQMVEEFEDWLFDEVRVVGEATGEAVSTTYGYHLMFYKGDEKPAWSHAIRNELGKDDYDKWLKAIKESEKPTFSEKDSYWNMIEG